MTGRQRPEGKGQRSGHLIAVGWSEGEHVGGGPHKLHDLHRLMGWAVFAQANRVVSHDVDRSEP